MSRFEDLLAEERPSVERYVRFRLHLAEDAEDCLQEIYLTAYHKFAQLRSEASFKAWILGIARNKCNDYFRKKARQLEIPVDLLTVRDVTEGREGVTETETVRETLELLGDKDRQILYLYFWKELPQAEIARKLQVPLGTVKSRLHTAKQNFRHRYPNQGNWMKGEDHMKRLPKYLPAYRIQEREEAPFSVLWEELAGWFLVPKPGEELCCGMYDIPSREYRHIYEMKVTGRASVHGIEGVELTVREAPYSDRTENIERTFVAQLTDTHCRYLAAMRNDNGVRKYITFLDGDEFQNTWGYGEDNCGNETHLAPKGIIRRNHQNVTCPERDYLMDIVGRYTVAVNGKEYDTVCVMQSAIWRYGVIAEQFLDRNGRTILWRRFNRDDWALEQYGKPWTQQLPENERLIVNGETYVHWYDCVTDSIF